MNGLKLDQFKNLPFSKRVNYSKQESVGTIGHAPPHDPLSVTVTLTFIPVTSKSIDDQCLYEVLKGRA